MTRKGFQSNRKQLFLNVLVVTLTQIKMDDASPLLNIPDGSFSEDLSSLQCFSYRVTLV